MTYQKKYNKKPKPQTFFIKDYESFSTETKGGKISQFAGLRTDENFNIIEKGVNIFCKLSEDALPAPEACLITGITPQTLEEHQNTGNFEVYNENNFTQRMITQLGRANTCTMGYNNFSFDDEVTRNLLFRNFRDPYAREWRGDNSRFDIYQLVIATYILRPDILNYPPAHDRETGEILLDKNNNPYPSFRLEELSTANGITHENAHDALNDVKATIGIAKIIKDKDPEFFNKMFELRRKKNVFQWFDTKVGNETRATKPFIYTSSFFGRENNFLGVMYKIADHPSNPNAIIAYNLRKDPENLINLPPEEIAEILYAKKEELIEKGLERVGLQVIKVNQCPMIEELGSIKHRANELGLNGGELRENILKIKNNFNSIKDKVVEIFTEDENREKPIIDVDKSIYSGGFSTKEENKIMLDILDSAKNGTIKDFTVDLEDSRLPEMLFRFKGRNYVDQMGVMDFDKWEKYCVNELTKEDDSPTHYNFNKYYSTINNLKEKYKDNNEKLIILNKLVEYGARLEKRFKIKKNLTNSIKP
jgi:exodeoxyribonuclease-1